MWLLDVADLSSSMLQNVICQQMHTICYAICVGADACQEYKPRSQAHTHKERETKLYEVRQDAYVPEKKREIYWWFTQDRRGLQLVLSKTLTRNHPYLKMGSHSLFIERRRNSQISSRLGVEIALTRLSVNGPVNWPKSAVDRPVDHAKSCKTVGLTGNIGRSASVDRPTGFLSYLSISVDRAVDRSKHCACRSTEVRS